jgi:Glycosyltransferase family 87
LLSHGIVINSASQSVEPEHKGTGLFWPRHLLGPRPGLKEINLVCWSLFVAFLLVPLCIVHAIQLKHGVGSVRQLNSDFVYLYGVGQIAREYPAASIYDSALQHQVFLSIQPPRNGTYGPSPYPPFVAMFFAPFTYVSFETAYYLWLGISLALYLFGIRAAAESVFPAEWLKTSLIICFALAFYPFIFGTLLNGQLATIAVCAVGVAIYQERLGNLFRSGLALALLSYKPTLLLLVVPMLLLTRRFRTLLGFTTGAGTLILGATAFAGTRIWPVYMRMLRDFGRVTGVRGTSHLQLWKYLDLNSAFAAIPDGGSVLGMTLLIFSIGAISAILAVLLWKSVLCGRPVQWLAWAATLTWTLLLNVYVPIYDSVLVTIAIVLTLGALRELGWSIAAEWITFLAIILFAVSWETESLAEIHGLQLLTIMLAAVGSAQLLLLHRAMRQTLPQPVASPI